MAKPSSKRGLARFCPHWFFKITETAVFDPYDAERQVGVRTEKKCRLCQTKFVTGLR